MSTVQNELTESEHQAMEMKKETTKRTASVTDQDLNQEEEEVDNKLAYKDMKNGYYYFSTILSLVVIATIASVLDSVYLMLDFVGIVGVIFISYFQPSMFYLVSWKNYEN